jgi:4-hydroxy-3-polyprenylbenzoate decarboxylase
MDGTQVGTLKHNVTYDDLRDYIDEVEKLGELRRIDGATWEEDIGLATELLQHSETAPCALFDNIPGYPAGHRVFTNFFGGQRQNITLGFPAHLSKFELSEAFNASYKEIIQNPIPYQTVETGPVMENIMEGDDVNVLSLPVPLWHAEDGGRYIGTGSFNVTRDPDENWINVGTYRVMVQDEKTVGFYISPGKHGRIHRQKYTAANEPMPVCVVVGVDPLSFLMSSTEIPYGVCEYDVIGAYRGRATQVVIGKHTGLPFPANAEIVLEGFCYPENERPEGPFGEWTGYYGSPEQAGPIIDIKAIYHRNNPIILGCPPQRPPEEQSRYRAVVRSALLKEQIEAVGVPDVQAVWCHECGGGRMFPAVSIKQRYPGHATQAGHIASQCRVGAYAGKFVVVVDEDIDVTNLGDVMWAMCFRTDPATQIDIIKTGWSTGLDPSIHPDRKAVGDTTNSRAIINACRPFHWKDRYPKVNMPDPELWAKAKEKWGWLLGNQQPPVK